MAPLSIRKAGDPQEENRERKGRTTTVWVYEEKKVPFLQRTSYSKYTPPPISAIVFHVSGVLKGAGHMNRECGGGVGGAAPVHPQCTGRH